MLITVNKQGISVTNAGILVSNSIGQYTASVSFSPEWANYDKVVVFKNGGTVKEIAVDGQDIVVPWEVLEKEGTLEIGAYGLEGANKRPTVWGKPLAILKGVEEGETAHEPTILPWEELARRIGDLSQLETETHESLVAAVNEVLSTVPAFLSELTPDVEHMTVSQAEKTEWSGKADTSDIPTNVSELENDAGYITQEEVPEITATAINNALGYTAADNADVQENAQEISQISESITEIQSDKADKSEIPSVPVKSVSAGGTAIAPDAVGNVNVPFAKGQDGEKRVGVVFANEWSNYGVQIRNDGEVRTVKASDVNIANRQPSGNPYEFRPIVPSNLDYAVKAALTDGKGVAYTAEEQAAARSRIGAEDATPYNTTIDITLAEDAIIDITTDGNGKPLALTAARIHIQYSKNSPVPQLSYTLYGYHNTVRVASYYTGDVGISTLAGIRPGAVAYWSHEHGYWSSRGTIYSGNITSSYGTLTQQNGFSNSSHKVENYPTVTRIYTSVALLAGTRIIIEGVQI